MAPQAANRDAPQRRPTDRGARGGGHDDLAAVGRRTEARCRVDGEADVAGLRQRRVAAVDADPNSYLQPVGPFAGGEVALDGHRRLDGGAGALEDREELVGARVDLAA